MPHKKITWLLVGDGAKAQLYSVSAIPLRLKAVPSGRFSSKKVTAEELKGSESGASYQSAGGGRHAIERRDSSHQRREDRFVTRVASAVNRAAAEHKFDALVIVAPPRALAVYRDKFDATANSKVAQEIHGEWANLGVHEVQAHLAAHVPL